MRAEPEKRWLKFISRTNSKFNWLLKTSVAPPRRNDELLQRLISALITNPDGGFQLKKNDYQFFVRSSFDFDMRMPLDGRRIATAAASNHHKNCVVFEKPLPFLWCVAHTCGWAKPNMKIHIEINVIQTARWFHHSQFCWLFSRIFGIHGNSNEKPLFQLTPSFRSVPQTIHSIRSLPHNFEHWSARIVKIHNEEKTTKKNNNKINSRSPIKRRTETKHTFTDDRNSKLKIHWPIRKWKWMMECLYVQCWIVNRSSP